MCFELSRSIENKLYLNFIEVILLVIVAAFSLKNYESLQKFCSKWSILQYFLSHVRQSIVVRMGRFPSFPLKEHSVLWTAEPSLQLQNDHL